MSDSKVPEFLQNTESEGITEKDLSDLQAMISRMKYLAESMAVMQEQIDAQKKLYNELSMEKVPELMGKVGMTEIKLESGEKVIVNEDVSVTIKDDFQFHKFLRKRGEDDIIKTSFVVGRIQSDVYHKILDAMETIGVDFEAGDSVHGATKKKYFRELLGFGNAPPEMSIGELPEWANVFVLKKTKIQAPRKKNL